MSHQEEQALDREMRAGDFAAYNNALLNMRGLTMPQMVIYLEAACVSFIREYFRNDSIFTWEDDEDLTRNKVWVGTEFPRNQMNSPDMRPILVVGMRGLQSNKAVLRDTFAQAALDFRKAEQTSERGDLSQIPMQISVMSTNRTVALFLACNMHSLFRAHAEFLRAAFQLNSISAPSTGTPSLMKEFPDHFIVPVTFNIEVLPKWEQMLSEETFKSVVLNIRGIVDKTLLSIVDELKPDQYVEQGMDPTA